jgi:hypothetical protein
MRGFVPVSVAGALPVMPTQVGIQGFRMCRFQIVGADLRQHDDLASAGVSMVGSVRIRPASPAS